MLQNNLIIELPTLEDTEHLGMMLAPCLKASLTITFYGEIGAGKTTLIRTILKTLGVTSAIKSPTFSLAESYSIGKMHIHHFDLYRIHEESELDYIGFRDYFTENSLRLIEWPERALHSLDSVDIKIILEHKNDGRTAQVIADSEAGIDVLSCLVSRL